MNYKSKFTDREGINNLNSTFINQKNLNGKRRFTQQDIQTPSHFVNEEIVETMPTATPRIISPSHPTLTTPKNKNTVFPQATIQSTVQSSVIPKNSQMDYQRLRPVTTSRQTNKQKTSKQITSQIITILFFQIS